MEGGPSGTADLIDKAVKIAIECKAAAEGPKLKDFNEYLANDREDIKELRAEVGGFRRRFPHARRRLLEAPPPNGEVERREGRQSRFGQGETRRDGTLRRCAPWT